MSKFERCRLSVLATLTTGVSRHLAPHAYQWRKKAAALSVYVYDQNQLNSSLVAQARAVVRSLSLMALSRRACFAGRFFSLTSQICRVPLRRSSSAAMSAPFSALRPSGKCPLAYEWL